MGSILYDDVMDLVKKGVLFDPRQEIKVTDIYSYYNPNSVNPGYIIAEPDGYPAYDEVMTTGYENQPIHTVIIAPRTYKFKKYPYKRYIIIGPYNPFVYVDDENITEIIINYVCLNTTTGYRSLFHKHCCSLMREIVNRPYRYYFHIMHEFQHNKLKNIELLKTKQLGNIFVDLHDVYINIYTKIKSFRMLFMKIMDDRDIDLDYMEQCYKRNKIHIIVQHMLPILEKLYWVYNPWYIDNKLHIDYGPAQIIDIMRQFAQKDEN